VAPATFCQPGSIGLNANFLPRAVLSHEEIKALGARLDARATLASRALGLVDGDGEHSIAINICNGDGVLPANIHAEQASFALAIVNVPRRADEVNGLVGARPVTPAASNAQLRFNDRRNESFAHETALSNVLDVINKHLWECVGTTGISYKISGEIGTPTEGY